MLALCREHRLEHRTKHIALRYFLARELQQRGQLRLAYVASEANTADIFTKALAPGDHQRFCTMLDCVGPAPSGVSQVDPLPGTVPVEVAGDSGAARGVASGGVEPGGAEPGGVEPWGVEPEGAESEGAGSGGAKPGGVEPEGVEPGGAESEGAESGGVESRGAASFEGPTGASPRVSPRPEPLSSQQLREWLVRRAHLRSGAAGAGGAGVTAGAGGTGGTAAAGPRGARTRGTGAAGTGGVGGAGAGDPTEPEADGAGGARAGSTSAGVGGAGAGGTGAGGAGAEGAGAGGTGAGDAGAGGAGVVDPGARGAGAGGAGGTGAGGTVRPRPYFVPLLQQSQLPLQPPSPLPAPSPYTEQSGGLTERREPASCLVSPVRTARCVPRSRLPPLPATHVMALRPSSVPLSVPLSPPPESSLPAVPDPWSDLVRAASPTISDLLAASALIAELLEFAAAYRLDYATALVAESESASPPSVGVECALGSDVLEDRQEDFECLAAAVPRFASMLLAPEGDPDAPDIPTPRSYAEAITGPYSSHWQAAMDVEMASWKSTSTYVDAIPPSRANIVDDMWIFRVKRPPGAPPAFKARYVARGFRQRQGVDYFHTFSPTPKMTRLRVLLHVAAQRAYELHSLDFSTAFLQGSLHEEIWLRRPPGFIGSFPAGTQWSLRRPVYGLRQVPREWHDTLRTTLAALGFAPYTVDPSLFLRTDTSLPPFYVLVYVDDLVFATADTEAMTLVKLELQKRHTCTDLGELRSYLGLLITRDRARCTITLTLSHMVHQVLQRFAFQFSSLQPTPLFTTHSFSAPPLDESVEPRGPYPKLVGCLMYLMTCTRPDLTYPLSLLARYVAPGRHRKVQWDAAKRVLRYLCSTSGMGLVLGGRGPVVLTGHADASWAEIYAGAMAAQELRLLTYLLSNLGEQPRSPPVLYVDNNAMTAWPLGRQRTAPHSSSFPPTTAPLQTLHLDVWGPALVGGTDQERYFLLVVHDYTRDTTVFPLRSKAAVTGVLIPRIRATHHQLYALCGDEGIIQLFTLPAFPQQNGIAERRIGLIMEPRVSLLETWPTLCWTGKVGDASEFRVWGTLSLVCTLRCACLGFPIDASLWQFYHPRARHMFSSQGATFDESIYFYRLHPHASHPVPLAPLFLVDPTPLVEPFEISSDSSGPTEGGDLAADDTVATRCSPRLETPPGFPP
ncbi:unnamed protein product [Closterium sp. NIES-54]